TNSISDCAPLSLHDALPICFNVHVPDNIEGITHKLGEVIMQTKIGGGTSGYFGGLRGRGSAVTDNGQSSGAVSFMKLFDTAMDRSEEHTSELQSRFDLVCRL